MRIAVLTLLVILTSLPIMAKAFDASATNDMAARLMNVVTEDLAAAHGGDGQGGGNGGSSPDLAFASQLNDIQVGQ